MASNALRQSRRYCANRAELSQRNRKENGRSIAPFFILYRSGAIENGVRTPFLARRNGAMEFRGLTPVLGGGISESATRRFRPPSLEPRAENFPVFEYSNQQMGAGLVANSNRSNRNSSWNEISRPCNSESDPRGRRVLVSTVRFWTASWKCAFYKSEQFRIGHNNFAVDHGVTTGSRP